MQRFFVVHWISGLSLVDFKAELAAVRRVGVQRARERREADAAAWRALAGMADDELVERRSSRTSILALCRESLRLGARAMYRALKPR